MIKKIIINRFENNLLDKFYFELNCNSERFEDFKKYIKYNNDIINLFNILFENNYNTFIFCKDDERISKLEDLKLDDIQHHWDKRFSKKENQAYKEMMGRNILW